MAMIPTDAGIRMRMQTEASLQPILPVSEIPAELADLRPGSTFSARIQEVLPENTYKALVAGRSLTLALPEGAKTGDTLELVVIDRTPRLIVAQLANGKGTADANGGAGYEFTSLSRTAQLIGALLARDGEPPPAAGLNRGQPLVAASPDAARLAADLAPQLAKAVAQSGLFYEAHQVQWIMGQRPVSDLQAEPQARHAPSAMARGADLDSEGAATRVTAGGRASELSGPMVLLRNLFGGDETRLQAATQQPATANPALAVPEELRPLVQQQLDAVATQRMAWHGEVWPGQSMDWQIEPDERRSDTGATDAERGWTTSLRLVTPRLGEIDARLSLTPQGARIAIVTPVGASAADLLDAAPMLEKSMAAAGVPLLALQVRHDAKE
jgi:hypothetical protein